MKSVLACCLLLPFGIEAIATDRLSGQCAWSGEKFAVTASGYRPVTDIDSFSGDLFRRQPLPGDRGDWPPPSAVAMLRHGRYPDAVTLGLCSRPLHWPPIEVGQRNPNPLPIIAAIGAERDWLATDYRPLGLSSPSAVEPAVDFFPAFLAALVLLALVALLALYILRISQQLVAALAQRQSVEDRLRDSERRYRFMFETNPAATLVWREDGTIIDWNRRAEQLFGWPKHQVLGRRCPELLLPYRERLRYQDLAERLSSHEQIAHNTMDSLTRDGRLISCEWVHSRLPDRPGEAGAVISQASDITERLRHEKSQRLAASVFHNTHEGILITSPNGVILEVNEAFSRISGYPREEVLGRRPSLLSSGRQDGRFYERMWRALHEKGHWAGEICNRDKHGDLFVESISINAVRDDAGHISHFVGLFSDITRRKVLEDEVQRLAFYDDLTKLPNRRLLFDRLRQSVVDNRRDRRYGALLFLDLDNFKPINDHYGHAAGDRLLIDVAERLRRSVREGDTVARYGGDEFVVMLRQLFQGQQESLHAARHLADKLRAILAQPYRVWPGAEISNRKAPPAWHQCAASIGLVLFDGRRDDADRLLRAADEAMYRAKRAGRNRIELGDPDAAPDPVQPCKENPSD